MSFNYRKKEPFFRKTQQYLLLALFFSVFLGLVSFGRISTLSLTVPFLISVLYFVESVIGFVCGGIVISYKRIVLYFLFLVLFIITSLSIQYAVNFQSLFLYIYYFSLYFLLDVRGLSINIYSIIKGFVIVSTVAAIYGIYQFIAYNLIENLPFKEIIPRNLWVEGMNVLTTIHGYSLFGKEVVRAHSIFSEPSIFSQVSAIGLLFAVCVRKKFKRKFWVVVAYISNAIGFILSLSGTGIIILVVCGLYLFFKLDFTKKAFWIFSFIFLFLFIVIFRNDSLITYFLGRSSELTNFSGYTSGYYRFVLPFKIGLDNLSTHFFGFGLGNDDIALNLYDAVESSISNGFGKIFVETGISGLFCLLFLFIQIKPRKNESHLSFKMVLFLMCICLNIVGTFMQPMFWGFALFLSFIEQPMKNGIYNVKDKFLLRV